MPALSATQNGRASAGDAPAPSAPAARVDPWTHAALLTLHSGWLALFAIGAAFVLPFEGFGVDLCAVHRVTGLPCPGCGLTRAFISVAHGEWLVALGANPFVLVLVPLFVALALLVLMPRGMRAAVERFLARHAELTGRAYKLLVFAFVGFGALRLAFCLVTGVEFP
ncbi:MAG: DUF2752 domain-containing protein [Myxococcaceae bacterium]|nr:DUF2752 domain-containing protein [Myxococcaceae bacterium]